MGIYFSFVCLFVCFLFFLLSFFACAFEKFVLGLPFWIFWEKIRTRCANFTSCPGRKTPTLRPWLKKSVICKASKSTSNDTSNGHEWFKKIVLRDHNWETIVYSYSEFKLKPEPACLQWEYKVIWVYSHPFWEKIIFQKDGDNFEMQQKRVPHVLKRIIKQYLYRGKL